MGGLGYGAPQQQAYGMPPNVYAQPYGRGYAQAAPAGYAPPPQGRKNSNITLVNALLTKNRLGKPVHLSRPIPAGPAAPAAGWPGGLLRD